jgi:virginiamycin B lyase
VRIRSAALAFTAVGITARPDGNLWFTERGPDKIGRITTSGEISELPLPTPESRPFGIPAGPDGNLWFTTEHEIGRIAPAGQITEYP